MLSRRGRRRAGLTRARAAAQASGARPPETYRGLLTGAYVLAPLLGRAVGNGVWQATD